MSKINQLDGCDTISDISNPSVSDSNETMSLPDIDRMTSFMSDSLSNSDESVSQINISNISVSDTQFEESEKNTIPIIVTNRPTLEYQGQLKQKGSTLNNNNLIKINNNVIERTAAWLPTISVINARSLWPKLKTFADQFKETGTHVAMITEIWGKGSKKDLYQITKLLEMKGIELLFNIRKDQRGGGTAVAVCAEKFSISRVNVAIPKGIEVTIVKLKRKKTDMNTVPLFVFSIYSSPRSKYTAQLIDFIMLQITKIKMANPKASFILGGDLNSIPLDVFSHLYPGIHQINCKPTRKGKILDFIATDLHQYYLLPEITNPLGPDNPLKAKASDHKIPIAKPKTDENKSTNDGKKLVIKRPMPQSAIDAFGRWVGTQSWEELLESCGLTL